MKLKFLLVLLFIVNTLMAKEINYVLLHDGLIDQRAQGKINQIGKEVKEKLGVLVFLHIVENNGINMDLSRDERITKMREYDKKVLSKFDTSKSYAVLTLATDQTYANILLSDDLKNIIDKDDVLSGYVIPLLASKDKNSLFAKTSAACLNGYAQIGDSLADNKGIELISSIGSSGKTAGTIWKTFMYMMVMIGIVSYTIIVLKQRKKK